MQPSLDTLVLDIEINSIPWLSYNKTNYGYYFKTYVLTVLDSPTSGDLPVMKSQLDLIPFGVEVSSNMMD